MENNEIKQKNVFKQFIKSEGRGVGLLIFSLVLTITIFVIYAYRVKYSVFYDIAMCGHFFDPYDCGSNLFPVLFFLFWFLLLISLLLLTTLIIKYLKKKHELEK
jgi:uncharacterized membrane protein SpoIIM required for sporulation